MTAIRTIEGDFVAVEGRYALVVGRFNAFVVESLVAGAVDTLKRHGVKEADITIIRVPGAFEIPLMVQKVAELKEFDAIITLGAARPRQKSPIQPSSIAGSVSASVKPRGRAAIAAMSLTATARAR